MGKPDEASYVVAFNQDDLRIGDLGLLALLGPVSDQVIVADPLWQRLNVAERVLLDRRDVAAAEARLIDPAAPSAWAARYDPGRVEVRLRVGELTRLVEGLEAFLSRSNPATIEGRLVDPPEKVRPLRDRLRQALDTHGQRQGLHAREKDLLS